MPIRNSTTLPTGKDIQTISGTTENYRPLLTTLAPQLGMSKQDSEMLVEAVVLKRGSSFLSQKDSYTLKAWLAKILVCDCVFKMSNTLFSEGKNCTSLGQPKMAFGPISLALNCPSAPGSFISYVIYPGLMSVKQHKFLTAILPKYGRSLPGQEIYYPVIME